MLKRVTDWLHRRNEYEICAIITAAIVVPAIVVATIFTQ